MAEGNPSSECCHINVRAAEPVGWATGQRANGVRSRNAGGGGMLV